MMHIVIPNKVWRWWSTDTDTETGSLIIAISLSEILSLSPRVLSALPPYLSETMGSTLA